jgi:predicted class III extradiol MEMO1 family dioxygenase
MKILPPSSQGPLLNYYTSGDIVGDYTDAVSYVSILFTVEEKK